MVVLPCADSHAIGRIVGSERFANVGQVRINHNRTVVETNGAPAETVGLDESTREGTSSARRGNEALGLLIVVNTASFILFETLTLGLREVEGRGGARSGVGAAAIS